MEARGIDHSHNTQFMDLQGRAESYWLSKFSGELSESRFPYDYPDNGSPPVLNKEKFKYSGELFSQLLKLSNRSDYRLHMIFTAVLYVLLYKYTGNKNFVLGIPVYKQKIEEDCDGRILPLANSIDPDSSFKKLLLQIREALVEAVENQNYPIEMLVHRLKQDSATNNFSLFDIGILLDNIHEQTSNQEMNYSLFFFFSRHRDYIEGRVEYNSQLYRPETIEAIANRFTYIMEMILSNVDGIISDLELMTKEEKTRLLYTYNNTDTDYPQEAVIHGLLEQQARKYPFRLSLSFQDRQLTMDTLNREANQIAGLLCEQGVKSGSIVGIMTARSLDMMTGIIGILKAGATFLPIDPNLPPERVHYMLKDSSAKLLLVLGNDSYQPGGVKDCQVVDIRESNKMKNSEKNPATLNTAADLAYVIYTSGSTGRPKGVSIHHRGVINFIEGIISEIAFTQQKIILALTTISFDIFVLETLLPLTRGTRVVIAPENFKNDPTLLKKLIVSRSINMVQVTPSRLKLLLAEEEDSDYLKGIQELMVGGEIFPDTLLEILTHKLKFKGKIYNLYGPTETTIWSTLQYLTGKKSVDIGKPIANTRIYILDAHARPQPVGIPGDLYIGGHGLARGYLNRIILTSEKFVPNPFRPGEKMYLTGDCSRWLPDGNIEFLGRNDTQVKIRGFRIELEEIENLLSMHEDIEDAVVVVKEDQRQDPFLCAYIVFKRESDISQLREFLSGELPSYMVPAYFVPMESIPLNISGKVNRLALPAPGPSHLAVNRKYIPPENEKDRILADIWQDVLGCHRIGIYDNFFELGGHSLKAVSIVSRVNKEFGTRLNVSAVFDRPNIAEMSKEVSKKQDKELQKIGKCPENTYYELSHSQKRLWFFDQMNPGNPAYNITLNARFIGKLDIHTFGKAVHRLVQRHESLRTSIESNEAGQPIQIIHQSGNIEIDFFQEDISTLPQEQKLQKLNQFNKQEGIKTFEISRAPLFRVSLLKVDNNEYIVVFVMHHIISDAWSMQILVEEFTYFYNQEKKNPNHRDADPVPLKFQYKDFVHWQNLLFSQQRLKSKQDYWLDKLGGELPLLDMPIDYPGSVKQSPWGDKVVFNIEPPLIENLKKLAVKASTTLFTVLTAAFKVLLFRYTSQEDIIIGTLTGGRSLPELEKIIGYFINILALRDTVKGNLKFEEFLKNVRRTMLDAYDHQDYPFDKLVDELEIRRDTGRSPVFDIMMVFQKEEDVAINSSLEDLEIKPIEREYVVNKYDLYLDITEMSHHAKVDFEFRTELFKKETIQRMKEHFQNLLESIARSPGQLISRLDILSETETRQLLETFNDTRRDIPRNECFHRLFERQVQESPERTAVKHNGRTASYRELNEMANQVGQYLARHGVTTNSMVGLLMKRSIHMLAAIIGIFKAGAAYLPIEVDYPEERIRYMLQDAEAGVLVTDPNSVSSENQLEGILHLEVGSLQLDQYPRENPDCTSTPEHYAYMIYTSGTTGKPKGVLVHQLGMINHLYAKINDLDIRENDRVAHTASHCFDISVWQFLAALLKGGTTIIFDHEMVLNPGALLKGLQEEQITIAESVPSLLGVFLEMIENSEDAELPHLRWMIPTGEALKPSLVQQWFNYYPEIKLMNAYGPTEASDDITHYMIATPADIGPSTVPIGKPVQNMRIYILNQDLSLCPIGVRGEICVAGIGVGKGYWKDVLKTEKAFVPNPYARDSADKDYAVLYKTGDIGCFRGDGHIECLGRIDNQVKIRGFRIELEEIEAVMQKHQHISKCAAVVKKDREKGDIVAAFIKEDQTIDIGEFKRFLLEYLPPYMIPSTFVKLEEFPLSRSGKVDRRALEAMNIDADALAHSRKENYIAPQTQTQQQIARIWSEALKMERIGIHDNFFDLGGHSLLIPGVFGKLNQLFPDKLQMADLFDYMTIQQMATYIDGAAGDEEEEIIELEL